MAIGILVVNPQEWVLKIILFFFLVSVLTFLAFQPADPAVYSEEPWSFTHNLFICSFNDPAERESLIEPTSFIEYSDR